MSGSSMRCFNGLSGSVYSGMGYSHGVYEMGITDPRSRLDRATTLKEVADILSDALEMVITFGGNRSSEDSLRQFRRDVMDVEDMSELLDIKVGCMRLLDEDGTTGVAYQLTYDFPSRTSTFSEARLADGKATLLGDPFVNDKGEEYHPFSRYI